MALSALWLAPICAGGSGGVGVGETTSMARDLIEKAGPMLAEAPLDERRPTLWPALQSARPYWLHLALFFLAYILAAGLGQRLAIIPGYVISFWPPAGLFVATLLTCPRVSWPWWVLAGCLAELTCNALWFHNPVPFALIYFSANALEALTAAWLIRRFVEGPFRLDRIEEVGAFVILGAGIAPMVGATVIALTDALLGKHAFTTAWLLVWLGDGTGLLVSTPLTLAVVRAWRERAQIPLGRLIEVAVLVVILLVVGGLSFTGYLPTPFMTMPPLLWIAARFQLTGAAAAVALITLLSALFAAAGDAQLAAQPEILHERIVMLQTFLGLSAVSALLVATVALQRQQALDRLNQTNAELETRVAERTANLRDSERRLAAVVAAMPIGLALIDRAGRMLVGNEVYQRYVPAAVPSRDPAQRQHWEGYAADGSPLATQDFPAARALRGERVWPGQVFLFHGDAGRGPIWLRVAALPFLDDGGRIVGATTVIEDIDQEKRASDALRASEARLRLASEAAGFGVYEVDLARRRAIWSPELRRIVGRPELAREVSFEQAIAIIHPEDRARVQAEMVARASRPGAYEMEFRIQRPDGSQRWVLDRGMTMASAAPRAALPSRGMGMLIDITERKQAEGRLAESEARLRHAIEAAALCAFDWQADTDGVVRAMPSDPGAFGITAAELGTTGAQAEERLHGDDRPRLRSLLAGLTPTEPSYSVEYRLLHPDGYLLWLQETGRGEFDGSGRLVRRFGVQRNITAQKQREEQVQLLLREVNHRSKNLLSLVLAIARQTAATRLDDFLERFTQRVQALAASQELLVRNEWTGSDLAELVRAQLAHFADLIGPRIQLGGPPLRVTAAAAQTIGMALHELATNAGKYGALSTKSGRIAITWDLESAGPDEPIFTMGWTEQGGPPVQPPTRRGFGSTVISNIVRLSLDAEVEVSHAPAGLSWRLRCPGAKVLATQAATPPRARLATVSSGQVAARARILVVEDEPLVALDILATLKAAGFAVIGPATSVAQAVAALAGDGCDLAILDVNLGQETAEPIAADLSRRGIPFIILSAYTPEQQPAVLSRVPWVAKPLQPEHLIAALERCLRLA